MSALEDSLRAVYKLPKMGPGSSMLDQETDSVRKGTPQVRPAPRFIGGRPERRSEFELKPFDDKLIDVEAAIKGDDEAEFTQEDQETIERLLKQEAALESAPLGPLAQELRAQGLEEDTELAHVRLGEVILPPEFLDDDDFSAAVESKFEAAGINPEEAIVGGIGTLNPATGLPQFFLKKIAKGLKKIVKKVAPVAGIIAAPFTGGASAALIGGIGGAISGGGIKGALKGAALGGAGSALFGGAGGAGGGISKFFNPAKGTTGIFGGQIGPNIRRGIGGLFKAPDFNPATGQISGGGFFGRAGEFILPGQDQRGLFSNLFGAGAPQQSVDDIANTVPGAKLRVERLRSQGFTDAQIMQDLQFSGYAPQTRPGIFSGIGGLFSGGGRDGVGNFGRIGDFFGGAGGGFMPSGGGGLGGGGFGNFAKMAGIGALAAGLGRLAYKDAQKQKGVPLIPLTTMSPTGRYNIEAEIARRMGRQMPNPVEFGLLPQGTLPQLSGGQPMMASLGGAIEELEGGMAQGMQEGGAVGDSLVDDFLSLPSNYSPKESKQFVRGNPRLTKLLRTLIVARGMGDMGKLNTKFAEAYRNDLEEANKIGLRQLAFGFDHFGARELYENPFEQPNNNDMMDVAQRAMGGGIMAFAQGGAVAMQEGGEMDPSNFPPMDGDINGPGTEQSDDIPAMLSDGEFVMTARAVRGAGSYEMQTEPGGIINLIPSLKEDRERGMDVMYKVMDTFSGQASPS